jgi:hypothetical protein
MRRGTPLKSRLATIALAYLLALQAVLGVWVAHTAAAASVADPSLTPSLCRTTTNADAQPSDDDAARDPHCVTMCLSGACGAGDPPAVASTELQLPFLRTQAASIQPGRDRLNTAEHHVPLHARGPPSIA